MNWLKKIKRNLKAKSNQSRMTRLERKYGKSGLAKQCMNCKHFVYREEKPRNWVCRCPDDKLKFKGNLCLGFEPGDHPEMVVWHSR